VCHGSL